MNRLATICVRFPLLAACIPKQWLTPDGGIGLIDLNDWEEIEYPVDDEDDENSPMTPTNKTGSGSAKNISSPGSALRLKKKTEVEEVEEVDGIRNNVFVHEEADDDEISLTQMLDELNKKSHTSE